MAEAKNHEPEYVAKMKAAMAVTRRESNKIELTAEDVGFEKRDPLAGVTAEETGPEIAAALNLPQALDVIAAAESFIRRYVVLPAGIALVITLWCAATYLADLLECFPYLALLSPMKRCGKTRCLEVLELLCARPWRGTAPSPASLYRMMADCPTLLLDEVEGLKAGKNASETQQAIMAVLNAGHRRGATVPRCAGKDQHLEFFPVYGPKVFAAIGALPDTLADRSIILHMQRRAKNQPIERFLFGRAKEEAAPICKAMAAWVTKNGASVRTLYARMGDLGFLDDRDADLWMPLFAVCSLAAPHRLADLKQSALALSARKQEDDTEDSLPLRLLADIKTVWPADLLHLSTAGLLDKLRSLDDSQWAEYEITPRKLSKWLRPFGLGPRQVRVANGTLKGYVRERIEAAWNRYLASQALLSETCETTRVNTGENDDSRSETTGECFG